MKRLHISATVLPEIKGDERYFSRRVTSEELEHLMDPVLSLEHFELTENMGPQEHREVSSLHYIFEDSAPFVSLDSDGNNMIIYPGSLLWNWTGNGLIHTESPVPEGALVEGIQILLKAHDNPRSKKPKSIHITDPQIPEIVNEGIKVKVICGSTNAYLNKVEIPNTLTLLHIQLDHGKEFIHHLPPGWSGTLFAIEGRFDVITEHETLEMDEGMTVAMSDSDIKESIEIFAITKSDIILVSSDARNTEPLEAEGTGTVTVQRSRLNKRSLAERVDLTRTSA